MNLRHIVLGTALMATSAAQAANITWSTGPGFGGPNGHQGILTNGTLVQAVNLAGATAAPVTVDPAGLSIVFSTVDSPFLSFNWTTAGSGGNTDAGWAQVLGSFEWSSGGNVTAASFLSGLTVGNTYQAQFFMARSDCCSTRTHWLGDGNGNFSAAVAGNAYVSIVGTFTADATTQALQVLDSTSNPILNAYVLRDLTAPVPEPGAWALLLAGLTAVAGVARRRRG